MASTVWVKSSIALASAHTHRRNHIETAMAQARMIFCNRPCFYFQTISAQMSCRKKKRRGRNYPIALYANDFLEVNFILHTASQWMIVGAYFFAHFACVLECWVRFMNRCKHNTNKVSQHNWILGISLSVSLYSILFCFVSLEMSRTNHSIRINRLSASQNYLRTVI